MWFHFNKNVIEEYIMLSIENYALELYLILEVEETHKILCMYLVVLKPKLRYSVPKKYHTF